MMKMKTWGIGIVLIGCAATIACVSTPYHPIVIEPRTTEAAPPPGGSDQPFYDDLAAYGRWVFAAGPGWVWSPYNVQVGWRPYQLGHWVFTDYGWTWASDEEWGSVVYHYGRWNMDPTYGWVWVPGTEWGPAWVAWHEGGSYVGWAPLPWQVSIQAGVGLTGASLNVTIEPSWWCFVNARNLVDPGLSGYIVPAARNATLIQVTRNVTNYTYIDNRIVNQGVRVESIGKLVGHTIPRYRVAQADPRDVARGGKVNGEEFLISRPDPGRGRKWPARPLPPGHNEEYRGRGFRPVATQPEPAPVATQPDAAPGTGEPQAVPALQPAPNPAPPTRAQPEPPSRSRGRKFLEGLMRQEPPRRSPQGATASGQPPAASSPSAATPPSAAAQPNGPAPGNRQGVTTPPANPDPAKGQPASANGRGRRNAPPKGGKPKADAPKSDGSDSDKAKTERQD